jgi:Cysteine rich repeat
MTKVQVVCASRLLALAAALVGFAHTASAQRPSEEQIAAVRQACRSDYIAHCAGVPTGGAQGLMCLREHLASLSATCQEAVNAAGTAAPPAAAPAAEGPAAPPPPAAAPETPPPAPAAGTAAAALQRMRPNQEQLGIIVQACGTDLDTRCAGAARGLGWELKCLRDNAANLSVGCQQVLAAIASTAPAEPAAAPAAPPAPPPAAAAPPPAAPAAAAPEPAAQGMRPTRAQLITILQACRADVGAHCAGAERGPGWRLKCLRDNAANLSPGCQQAFAAVASGAPAEPAAGPAAPPPAAAAPRMERPVSPRDVLMLLRTSCSADFRNYCRGVPFGGGRVIGCLREHAANLSPDCQQAFMALIGGR